jgi:hypothetical protein
MAWKKTNPEAFSHQHELVIEEGKETYEVNLKLLLK